MSDIYVIKYALTDGIRKLSGCEIDGSGYAHRRGHFTGDWTERNHLYSYSDYRLTKGEALQAAVEKRDRKIASLKKQIKKLEAMVFEVKS